MLASHFTPDELEFLQNRYCLLPTDARFTMVEFYDEEEDRWFYVEKVGSDYLYKGIRYFSFKELTNKLDKDFRLFEIHRET